MQRTIIFLVAFFAIGIGVSYLGYYYSKDNNIAAMSTTGKGLSGKSDSSNAEVEEATGAVDSIESELGIAIDKNATLAARLDAIHKLPRIMNDDQQKVLRKLINTKGENSTIRNDAMLALEKQYDKQPGLAGDLVTMFKNDSEDLIWRDYCVQHLAEVYSFSEVEKKTIENLLVETAKGSSGDKENFAGTALISLQRISAKSPEVAKVIKKLSLEAVKDSVNGKELDQEKLVTALQVAADNNNAEILSQARKFAVDTNLKTRLRMSAVGTIGKLGTKEDVALLEELSKASDSRLKRAAQLQLKAMKKRLKL